MSVFTKNSKSNKYDAFSATSAFGSEYKALNNVNQCNDNAGIDVMTGGKKSRKAKGTSKRASKRTSKRASKRSSKQKGGKNEYFEKIGEMANAVKSEQKDLKDGPGLRTILGKILKNNGGDVSAAKKDAIEQVKSGKLEKESKAKQQEIIDKIKANSKAKKGE
jgi:hypothetical protein